MLMTPCACGGDAHLVAYNGSYDTAARVECWACGVGVSAGSLRTEPVAKLRWELLQHALRLARWECSSERWP